MKFSNPFKKKANPEMDKAYADKKKSTQNKIDMADRLIRMVEDLKIERRCGIVEYHGPERRAV